MSESPTPQHRPDPPADEPEPWRLDGRGVGLGPEPTTDSHSRQALRGRALRWLSKPALARVIESFDAAHEPPAAADAATLAQWSAAHLDTRHGRERHEAPPHSLTARQVDALEASAAVLGLERTAPPQRRVYDHVFVLGGTVIANRLRTEYVLDLIESGTESGVVVALGGNRLLTATERALGVRQSTEFEHLASVAAEILGPLRGTRSGEGGDAELAWRDDQFTDPRGGEVRLLCAPAPSPGRRAGTVDCLRFAFDRLSPPLGHVLLVTSAIYAPYAYFATAPELCRAGVSSAEVVGTPGARTTDDRGRRAQYYAQEINSAIQAAAQILAECGKPGAPPRQHD